MIAAGCVLMGRERGLRQEEFLVTWITRGRTGTHLDFPGQGAACPKGY